MFSPTGKKFDYVIKFFCGVCFCKRHKSELCEVRTCQLAFFTKFKIGNNKKIELKKVDKNAVICLIFITVADIIQIYISISDKIFYIISPKIKII